MSRHVILMLVFAAAAIPAVSSVSAQQVPCNPAVQNCS